MIIMNYSYQGEILIMPTQNTPLAEQPKIVLFGLRNSGKSSLMNNLFENSISIVSDNPGTTTDPVTKTIELGRLGPTAVTDTAGFDDTGELGGLRVKKSAEMLGIADIPVFVTRADQALRPEEKAFFDEITARKPALIIALTFTDQGENPLKTVWASQYPHARLDNLKRTGFTELKKILQDQADKIEFEISPLEGLVEEGDLLLLVTPIDLAAPKGRLILPQVETIRDALDKDCAALVLKERELKNFYDRLPSRPKLVITDSQAFSKVSADIPEDQPLTSFSILFARKKGDLTLFTEGVKKLSSIKPGSKILVLESCSHHRQADDIGTVKIPRLFRQIIQPDVTFEFLRELPEEAVLKKFSMVINCAGCMVTRNKILSRLEVLNRLGIPAVNYGLFLAFVNGLLPRALEPFPYEYGLYRN